MSELRELAIPLILGGVVAGLLVFAGLFVFTSILVAGALLLLIALYDRSNPATIPGVTGWWFVVAIVAVLVSLLGYSKGVLTLAP